MAGVMSFSHPVFGQAALPPCVVAQPVAKATPSEAPQFYDEPQFTVAGVKDPSETGGHGSDTVRRTTETLAKETVGLNTNGANDSVKAETNDQAALRASLEREPADAGRHHA